MSYKIPLFELNYNQAETDAVVQTLESKWISMGEKCLAFEKRFASMSRVMHSVALSSCTSALHLALMALEIGVGDEVIVPSLTFVATANSVKYVGATPVFADIVSTDDLTISPIDIEKKITKNTKAIIVMHFAGFSCEMNKILSIAKKHNLKIIEDACHGPFAEFQGEKLGTIGDIGCFSFFSNKNISTGEGGMLITNNVDIFEKVKLLRSHGMTTMSFDRASGHATTYDVIAPGYNYRMDDIRASLGLVQLEKIEKDLLKRAEVRSWYIRLLSQIEEITVPFSRRKDFSSNYIMPIVLNGSNCAHRDKLRNKLHNHGIQTSIHYPAVHLFESFGLQNLGGLEVTEYVSDTEVTLPMYASLTYENVEYIVESLNECLKN